MEKKEFIRLARKVALGTASKKDQAVYSAYFDGIAEKGAADHVLSAHEMEWARREVLSRLQQKISYRHSMRKATTVFTKAAACMLLIVVPSLLVFENSEKILNYFDPIKSLVHITPKGKLELLTLSDSTQVWINAGSVITYPKKFRGKLREVTLQGEAFFDVVKDVNRPFVVHSGAIRTVVLGTSFNVKNYKDEGEISVTVATGKVGVGSDRPNLSGTKTSRFTFLTPNEKLVFHTSRNVFDQVEKTDAAVASAWKEDKVIFNGTLLSDVVAILNRKYNVKISYDPSFSRHTLYGSFTRMRVKEMLQIVCKSIDAALETPGDSFFIKDKKRSPSQR